MSTFFLDTYFKGIFVNLINATAHSTSVKWAELELVVTMKVLEMHMNNTAALMSIQQAAWLKDFNSLLSSL